MRIYSKIDIGKERSLNQDAFFAGEIGEDIAFAVVCDGMGGANAGDIASQTAVREGGDSPDRNSANLSADQRHHPA